MQQKCKIVRPRAMLERHFQAERFVRGASALGSILVAACSFDGTAGGAVATVRDSMGVRIVEHGALDSTVAFEFGDPLFRHGDDAGEYQFVRITGGALRTNGSSVVGDSRTDELLAFEPGGAVAWLAGGSGDGPGEFRGLQAIGWRGDTVIAQDAGSDRVSYLIDGEIIESRRLPTPMHFVAPLWIGGGLLIATAGYYRPISSEAWISMPLIRHELGTEVVDTVLKYDFAQGIPSRDVTPNPFRAFGAVAANGSRIVTGRGDVAEVRLYDLDGALLEIWRWRHPEVPLDDAAWASYAARRMESPGRRSEGEMRKLLRELRAASQGPLPAFGALQIDHLNRVWIGEYTTANSRPLAYQVFGPDGEWLGRVELPPRIEILDISADRVLAIQRDEFDVESVVVLPILERGASP